ncbi:MAG: endonuclease V [Thermoguttaceae bacterium]|jgi:deoxyribonuclease V|nr:endonuclease V [Thermoguttaceae bacterium]
MSLSIPTVPDLFETLHHLVRQIPRSRVATFGDLAGGLGDPIAARWVGSIVAGSIPSAQIPWHRIVRVDGSFSSLPEPASRLRRRLLAEEGVEVCQDRVDLQRFGFRFFCSERPLATLRSFQYFLVQKVRRSPRTHIPELVAGVDVSYRGEALGQAAYALVETRSGRLVWSQTICRRIEFPYITSYLTFRELPILLELLEVVRAEGKLAEVVLVDGSGVLHPTGAGIASHLGIIGSVATIGVTKKLLHGRVSIEGMQPGEARPVLVGGRAEGVALCPATGTRRPVFVSPGHRLNLPYAERLARMLMFGRRLPAPVYWADRLSRE